VSLEQKLLSDSEIVTFDFASQSQERQIQTLLASCGLPFEDIHEHLIHFITARRDEVVIGCVGLEVHGNFGLARSLVVAEKYRRQGISKILCELILEYARKLSITNLYLTTDSSIAYFSKLQFEKLDPQQAPEAIRSTKEFTQLNPSTAIFMSRAI
jgi:amino-acid N-acetyltransferase